jgi:hypothetical protein
MTMITRCRPMLTACLLSAAHLAQASDGMLSADAASGTVASVDEGWTAGSAGNPAATRGTRAALRDADRSALDVAAAAPGSDTGSEIYAGYHGKAGGLGYSALVRVRSYPGMRLDESDGHAELSAGVNWKSLYARYDLSFTHDYLGVGGARGTSYLDVGARHPIGDATFFNLHAGDARVAGNGNALWDWKDLRAGFSRKLEDGWMMVLNVRRVYGNSALADRHGLMLRSEGHNPALVRGHRGLVLTFKRGF